jgi:hypothetical protein
MPPPDAGPIRVNPPPRYSVFPERTIAYTGLFTTGKSDRATWAPAGTANMHDAIDKRASVDRRFIGVPPGEGCPDIVR